MLKVLLVKTSSLGDVVHNLPAATDIQERFPQALIDWAVEEDYAPLVRLHPAIRKVIPVAIRRWRSRLFCAQTWSEIAALRKQFRGERYDAVIDTQGLVKSALLGRLARGRHHGFDAGSAREAFAACFYEVKHRVDRNQHAVLRNRALVASALGFCADTPAGYGIAAGGIAAGNHAVLLHSTSRADKLWPEERWIALGAELERRGLRCVLPWGNEEERARSARLAAPLHDPLLPERMPLADLVALLGGAAAVVGVDTGLTHLAAALGAPVVAIYTGTDPKLTGVFSARRACNLGRQGEIPEVGAVGAALCGLGVS